MSFPVPNEYNIPKVKYNNGDVLTYPPAPCGDDTDISELESRVTELEDWLGYPKNLFNGTFTTTHPSNWGISQDGNEFTFTHLSQYESGYPSTGNLELPVGTYHFTANFNGTANLLALYDTTPAWVKTLTEDCTFTIEEGKTYYIRIGVIPAQGTSVTVSDIVITDASTDGKIGEIESEIEAMQPNVDTLVSSAKETIQPVSDTVKKFISNTGAISNTGSSDFYVSEYAIEENTNYWISASTMWANAYWAWYNGNTLVSVSQISPRELTAVQNVAVTAPSGANILYVAHHTESINAKVEKIGLGYGKRWLGKKWVCVGDSLTAENIRTTKHYFDYVADATGITVVNMGYSGSGYARLANENHAFYQRISSCPTDADVVTIFGSFNDLGAGLPLGTVDDTGTDTLAGCINTTIDNLQAVIPLVNLGIVAPTPWANAVPATSGVDFNYVEMIKAICAKRSIPYLDLWRESNLRPWDADFRALAYSKDEGNGTHPDENGHKLIAPRFKGFLETLLM